MTIHIGQDEYRTALGELDSITRRAAAQWRWAIASGQSVFKPVLVPELPGCPKPIGDPFWDTAFKEGEKPHYSRMYRMAEKPMRVLPARRLAGRVEYPSSSGTVGAPTQSGTAELFWLIEEQASGQASSGTAGAIRNASARDSKVDRVKKVAPMRSPD